MDVVEATTAATNEDIGIVETAENGEQPVLERDLELELDEQLALADMPPLLCERYVPYIRESSSKTFPSSSYPLFPMSSYVVHRFITRTA